MALDLHYIYRHLDSNGRVLYVGCTTNIERRTSQHRYSAWYPHIARIVKRKVIGRIEALAEERRVITKEQPQFNIQKRGPKKVPSYDHKKWRAYVAWRMKRVVAMRERGMFNRAIAKRFGVSIQAISNVMRRARENGLV